MAQKIQDVMTSNPTTCPHTASLVDAAKKMRDEGIGNVVVTNGDKPCGIVTDRDIVVKAIADGRSPNECTLDDVCSHQLVSVAPGDSVDKAVGIMRDKAIRRVAVMDGGKLTGMVSLGDLAIEGSGEKALDDISAAPTNN
jgi:signal-transduction protein with cAMP-binding, CBS, and nucleotidyltransferase domain